MIKFLIQIIDFRSRDEKMFEQARQRWIRNKRWRKGVKRMGKK